MAKIKYSLHSFNLHYLTAMYYTLKKLNKKF